MKNLFAALAVLCATLPCAAQSKDLSDWTKLIDGNKCDAAKTLCSGFVDSKDIAQQVDAQKCLANVALCGAGIIQLEGDDAGGGTIRDGLRPDAVDEALVHLNAGLKLAPWDLSIHQGRLHVLEQAGRYDEMIKALDESCSLYKGKEAPDVWLAYASELAGLRQYKVALEFSQVMDKHYPNSPDIIGNIGAFLDMLGRMKEAIPYLQKAIALAPNDPINTWDLARAYDNTNQVTLANLWYQKGLSQMTYPAQLKDASCRYAVFVETKLKDRTRACDMEKQSCTADEQTACAVSSVPSSVTRSPPASASTSPAPS